jgi:hypothetical protein
MSKTWKIAGINFDHMHGRPAAVVVTSTRYRRICDKRLSECKGRQKNLPSGEPTFRLQKVFPEDLRRIW